MFPGLRNRRLPSSYHQLTAAPGEAGAGLAGPVSLGTSFYEPGVGETPYGTGSFTHSVTTVDNSLLVVAAYASADVTSGTMLANMVISGGGLTWTRVASRAIFETEDGNHESCLQIWVAQVTTGATFNVTFDCGAISVYAPSIHAAYYTGYNTSDPIGAGASFQEFPPTGDFSGSLDATPASTSAIHAAIAIASEDVSITSGTGYTEIAETYGNGAFHNLGTQYRPPGSTSTTVAWTNIFSTYNHWAMAVAVEIKAA